MLSLFVAWAGLALLSTAVGFDVLRRCRAVALGRPGDRAVLATWLGLTLLAALLLAAALVVPLSPGVSLAIVGGAAGLALASRGTRDAWRDCWSRAVQARAVGLGLLTVAVGMLAAQPVTWYDTGLYHYGALRWLQSQGEVPGLALLHMRFGQVSSWFALSAPLDAGPWQGRMAATTGSFAVLAALTHALLGGARVLTRSAATHDWFAFFLLPIPLLVIRIAAAPSPSPDVPVLLLTGVVAWAFLLVSAQGSDREPGRALSARITPLLLAAGAVAMKLSALPILAVSFFFFWRNVIPTPRMIGASVAASALFLVPLVAAGLVTSGCPLYPSSVGCLDVSWGVGAAQAADYSGVIKQWAQWIGPTPPGQREWGWLWPWVRANRVVAALLAASVVALPLLLSRTSRRRGGHWVAAVGIAGIAFVLLTAPSDRFVFAYALVAPALLAAQYASQLWPARVSGTFGSRGAAPATLMFTTLWTAAAALLAAYALYVPRRASMASASAGAPPGPAFALIVPPRLPSAPVATRVRAGGFEYRNPLPAGGTDQCWATPQPCTPYLTHEGVALRNAERGFRAGFRRPRTLARPEGVRVVP